MTGVPDLTGYVSIAPSDEQPNSLTGNVYGTVELATYTDPQTQIQTTVTVRSLFVDSVEEATSVTTRLDREAAIWIKLDHPNILPFFGKCKLSESPRAASALVYLYCANGSVVPYLQTHSHVDRAHLVRGIARGLDYLHEREITHGDLSPSNILIKDDGEPAIAHFGRARLVGYRGHTTSTRGATRYTAPEAWSVKTTTNFSKEADVYSFGLTALHILSDQTPYYDINDTTLDATSLVRSDKALKNEKYPGVPSSWWSALEGCWNYDPQARPVMSEVVDKLERLV